VGSVSELGLIERERWLQALSIDLQTGLDPAGFKVRAAQGLDAAVSQYPCRLIMANAIVRVHSR
jgi:hypothetical protein